MLFRPAGTSKMQRIQGAFITEAEIAKITEHWSDQGNPTSPRSCSRRRSRVGGWRGRRLRPDADDLLDQAAQIVVERTGVGLDDPAAPARRLHPGRPADRHARAARGSSPATRARSPPGARLAGGPAAVLGGESPTRLGRVALSRSGCPATPEPAICA
jgi:S-DNA-T family DNA segregation ATPase FtsK/SpoIIIE